MGSIILVGTVTSPWVLGVQLSQYHHCTYIIDRLFIQVSAIEMKNFFSPPVFTSTNIIKVQEP